MNQQSWNWLVLALLLVAMSGPVSFIEMLGLRAADESDAVTDAGEADPWADLVERNQRARLIQESLERRLKRLQTEYEAGRHDCLNERFNAAAHLYKELIAANDQIGAELCQKSLKRLAEQDASLNVVEKREQERVANVLQKLEQERAEVERARQAIAKQRAPDRAPPIDLPLVERRRDPLDLLTESDKPSAKIQDDLEAEIRAAEKVFRDTLQRATDKRLSGLRLRVKTLTMNGDDEKATLARQAVGHLEKADPITRRPRPKNLLQFKGHTYGISEDRVSWQLAKKRCEEMGGHLVVIDSLKEAQFIAQLTAAGEHLWTGATNDPRPWHWLLGIQVDTKDTGTLPSPERGHYEQSFGLAVIVREANGSFGQMNRDSVTPFRPIETSRRLHYICEWDQ